MNFQRNPSIPRGPMPNMELLQSPKPEKKSKGFNFFGKGKDKKQKNKSASQGGALPPNAAQVQNQPFQQNYAQLKTVPQQSPASQYTPSPSVSPSPSPGNKFVGLFKKSHSPSNEQRIQELTQQVQQLTIQVRESDAVKQKLAMEQRAASDLKEKWHYQNFKLNLMADMLILRILEQSDPRASYNTEGDAYAEKQPEIIDDSIDNTDY